MPPELPQVRIGSGNSLSLSTSDLSDQWLPSFAMSLSASSAETIS
jgi:hypothetical protein